VHHDLMLPNFPLCLEWLDFPAASSASHSNAMADALPPVRSFGNYIAVGTFDPEIEIWSLDVVEAMYPDMVLGRPDKTAAHVPTPLGTGKKKRKKTKKRAISSAHHVDAVLSLSWNKTHRNLLASASADHTVKLWDLSRDPTISGDSGGAIRSFDSVHKDKVQAVHWNDKEPTVLLTGSYDRTVRTFDTRAPDAGVGAVVGADVEALRWDPWEAHGFYVNLTILFLADISDPSHHRYPSKMASCSILTHAHSQQISSPLHSHASPSKPTTAPSPPSTLILTFEGVLLPGEQIS
jgi:periodic tryptophan protein 1